MTASEQVNILLVDDQPAKLLTYEAILGDLGENLIKANSGQEALELLLRLDIAVVLIDVCMPQLDGFELAGMIREHPRFQKTAIILVSAVHMTELDRLRGYDCGAVDYVSVPIIPEVLRAKVGVFADLYRKTQELHRLNQELERRVSERTAALEASTARLHESEERLKLAVEGAGMATWDTDLRTGKTYWSKTHFTILGYEPIEGGEATREMWLSRIYPHDLERVTQELERAQNEGTLFCPEYRIIRADNGKILWLSVFGRFLYEASGEAIRFVGVFFDISERKLAEVRLATEHDITRAIETAQSLEDAAPALLQAVSKHLNGVIATLWLPDKEKHVLRCAHIEVSNFDDQLKPFIDVTMKLAFAPDEPIPGSVWTNRRPVWTENLSQSAKFYRAPQAALARLRAGIVFPILSGEQCHCIIECFTREPMAHDQPFIEMLAAIGSEVGQSIERKWLENTVRESEERFRNMADHAPMMVWVTEMDGTCTYLSKSWYEFTGQNPEGEIPVDLFTAIHPQDRAGAEETFVRAHAKHEDFRMEYRLLKTDGQYRWMLDSAAARFASSGMFLGYIGSIIDITERKEVEEERKRLLESERIARNEAFRAINLKDDFLATLSHELRTPLNSILGWAQLLRRGRSSASEIQKGLEIIDRNVQAQSQMVDDLFEINRIMQGKANLDISSINLATVVDTALEMVKPVAQAKSIHLSRNIPDESFPVEGDVRRLQQIICNLLSNAIKFTPQHGRVQVSLTRKNQHIEIRVEDNGQGISADFLPHIFERFRQGDSSIKRKFGGLGLGLAIVKHLTELHGGSVSAQSAGEKTGSTFTVRLPMDSSHDFQNVSVSQSTADSHVFKIPSLKGIRVLAVDDEVDALTLVHRVLEESEAQVLSAGSAIEALSIVQSNKLDLLVCDISMPDMDGYEFIKKIRSLSSEQGGKLPAVALTAFARIEDQQRALEAGYQVHLAKPIEPLRLVRVLSHLVRNLS